MSYEVIGSTKVLCPCKKGQIKIIDKMNDWGQIKEESCIDCEFCKNNYKLVTENKTNNSGDVRTFYYLENIKTKEKMLLDL